MFAFIILEQHQFSNRLSTSLEKGFLKIWKTDIAVSPSPLKRGFTLMQRFFYRSNVLHYSK